MSVMTTACNRTSRGGCWTVPHYLPPFLWWDHTSCPVNTRLCPGFALARGGWVTAAQATLLKSRRGVHRDAQPCAGRGAPTLPHHRSGEGDVGSCRRPP